MSDINFIPSTIIETETIKKGIPLFSVILLNDDVNEIGYVSRTLREILGFSKQDADIHTWAAHNEGLDVLMETYREAAEFYHERLTAKYLTVVIEPVD